MTLSWILWGLGLGKKTSMALLASMRLDLSTPAFRGRHRGFGKQRTINGLALGFEPPIMNGPWGGPFDGSLNKSMAAVPEQDAT